MNKNVLKLSMSLGLAAMAFAPAAVLLTPSKAHADGFNFNVDVGGDDEAHFHFGDRAHVNPEIWKAADRLRQAKHDLWRVRHDWGGHKGEAIRAINAALDELNRCAESERRHER